MNYTTPEPEIKQPPTSIFSEAIDYTPFEKSMKGARTWLYVIAGLQLIMGIYEYGTTDDPFIAWFAFGIDAGIGVIFLLLALWSRKKPKLAFTTALTLYVLLNIGFMMLDPENIYRGILLKIIAVVALVKAVKNARQYEAIKNSIGEQL